MFINFRVTSVTRGVCLNCRPYGRRVSLRKLMTPQWPSNCFIRFPEEPRAGQGTGPPRPLLSHAPANQFQGVHCWLAGEQGIESAAGPHS